VIHIKKTIFIFVISLLFLSKANAVIKDALFATVGNKAITQSDIVNEVKTILILNGQAFSESQRTQIESAAIKSIIKRTVKQIEISKYKTLQYNIGDLNKELKNMASNLNVSLETLKKVFSRNEIDFSNVIDRVKTDLLWNSLIFEIYKNRLSINIDEIDEQLKLIQNKKEIEEYLISEIIVRNVQKEKMKAEIEKIKNKINTDGFEKTAMSLSISQTAMSGGNLGWISENVISEKFRAQIMKTPVGNISDPIFLPEGILIFKVRDKRMLKNVVNLEDVKNQLVNAEKTKILNMHSLSHYDNLRRSLSINYY
tara:strand:- start:1139 stop:2074 length:936 start_codon:yes stop_codon:yes gene_type:complete